MAFFIFIISFVVSFIGILIPGMTSSLGVSSMVLMGIPIQIAKTTFQIWATWSNIMWFIALRKSQKIDSHLAMELIIVSILGGYIGSQVLVTIDTVLLFRLTWLFLIIVLIIQVFFKDIGVIEKQLSHKRKYFGIFLYGILYVFYSVFPMGAGAIFHTVDTLVFRITILQSRILTGYCTIPFLLGFLIPVIQSWTYNLSFMIMYLLGSWIGWYLWAHSGLKLGNTILKKILMIWLFCLGIYFIFFAKT